MAYGITVETQRARRKRIAVILIITAAVELGLFGLTKLAPVMTSLVQPVYVIVLIVAAGTVWHAARRHVGQDRRHGDRRDARRD